MPHRIVRRLAMVVVMATSGPAAADAVIEIFSDDVADVPIGTTRIMHSFLDNGGDTAASVSRVEISGPDAGHFAFANPALPCSSGQRCDDGFVIDPFGFQNLDIGCTVDRLGELTATLTVTSDASNSPTSTPIFCDAAGPHFEITPQPLEFGTTAIGFRSPAQLVVVRNTGSSDVRYRVWTAGDFASSLDSECTDDPCVLRTGATLTVSVVFAPHGSGLLDEQIELVTSLGIAPIIVRGTGTGAALMVEQPAGFQELDLGTTLLGTTTAPGTVRIRNTGDQPLHVAALLADNSEAAFAVVAGPAPPFDLAPDATATWQVTCHPVRFGGNFGAILIESNAGFVTYPIYARCVGDGGALQVPSQALEFPPTPVGTSATTSLVLQNVGDRPVTIAAIATSDPQFVVAASLPVTVAAHGTAAVDVTFSPVHGGNQFAEIVVTDDGVVPVTGFASGVGRTGHADLSPEAPDLGLVQVGSTSADLVLELGNHGEQTIQLISSTVGDPAQFELTGPLSGISLEPDQDLQLVLRVTLGSTGVHSTDLTFTFDQGPPVVAHVTATGVTSELAVATWDGRPSDGAVDFGKVRVAATGGGLISVTNTGTATLHIASCDITGDPAFRVSTACALELAPRASADLKLTFAPTTRGLHTASLRFTSDAATTMLDVPLAGFATPALGCSAGRDDGRGLAWLIAGLLAVRWRRGRRRGVPGERGRRSARGSTARTAGLAIAIAGCGVGDPGELEAARRSTVSVTRTGTGSGIVQSLGREIDCGTRCTASFSDLLHLAAIPVAGSVFVGWDGACAGTGTCVIAPAAAPTAVVARFEHHHRVSITGEAPSAPFAAEVTLDGVRCALPCVRDVLEGTTLALDVFTLVTFTGWTGGCTPSPAPCTVTVTADVDLTAHFTTRDERWSVADDVVPSAVTVVDDDPVVAGSDGTDLVVTRYSSAGARSWRTRIAAGPGPQIIGLDHGADGSVYALVHVDDPAFQSGALTLHKLDGAGQPRWSATLDASSLLVVDVPAFPPDVPRVTNGALAVAPDGDAIVIGLSPTLNSFVRAYAGDGSVHWTRTVEAFPRQVSVDAGGVVTIAGDTPIFDQGQVDRFGPDGSPVAHYDLPEVTNDGSFVVTYHAFAVAGDQLVCASADNLGGSLVLRAVDVATGTTTTWLDDLFGLQSKLGLRPDGHGNLLMLAEAGVYKMAGREIVSRRGPDHARSPGGALDAHGAADVAADAHDRVVEAGGWLRPCEPDEPCDDGFHRSGYVRAQVP